MWNSRAEIFFYLSLPNQFLDVSASYNWACNRCSVLSSSRMKYIKLSTELIVFSLAFMLILLSFSVAYIIILYLQLGTEVPILISQFCVCAFTCSLGPWWPWPLSSYLSSSSSMASFFRSTSLKPHPGVFFLLWISMMIFNTTFMDVFYFLDHI